MPEASRYSRATPSRRASARTRSSRSRRLRCARTRATAVPTRRSRAGCGRRSSATATGSSTRRRSAGCAQDAGVRRPRRRPLPDADDAHARGDRHPRGVARALRLNEDLTEAIGLGHDLGHPPFGHAGEAALDACLRERFGRGFRHNEHSLRVVEHLERDGRGLNLTERCATGSCVTPAPRSRRRSRGRSSGSSTASPTSTTTSTTRSARGC